MYVSRKGFSFVEILITLSILVVMAGFFIPFVQFSPFFGKMDDKRYISTVKEITSDLESFFIQYPIQSGSIVIDTVPSKYYDRIMLNYSGWVVILWVTDKNTRALLGAESNDTGFLGWNQKHPSESAMFFIGEFESMTEHIEILSLKWSIQNNLLRILMSYKPTGWDGSMVRYFLYTKNLTP